MISARRGSSASTVAVLGSGNAMIDRRVGILELWFQRLFQHCVIHWVSSGNGSGAGIRLEVHTCNIGGGGAHAILA